MFDADFSKMYRVPDYFADWKEDVESWKIRVRHYKPLGEAALDLRSAIQSAYGKRLIKHLTVARLNQPDGIDLIVDALKVFDEQPTITMEDLMEEYETFQRQQGMTLHKFITNFEDLEARCSRQKLNVYTGTSRVLKMLRAACLEPKDRQALLTATGSEYDYKLIIKAMATQWPKAAPPWCPPGRAQKKNYDNPHHKPKGDGKAFWF